MLSTYIPMETSVILKFLCCCSSDTMNRRPKRTAAEPSESGPSKRASSSFNVLMPTEDSNANAGAKNWG